MMTKKEQREKIVTASQTALLELWDELGIPHKKTKQELGQIL